MKKLSAPLLLTISLFLFQSTSAQDTVRYAVIQGKDIKGVQKTWRHGENEYHYFFQYNDRGRGDSIYETVMTDAKGMVSALKIEGVDYQPVAAGVVLGGGPPAPAARSRAHGGAF